MHILVWQLRMYLQQHRQQYLIDHNQNMNDADLILDGMQPKEVLAKEVVKEFRERYEKKSIEK